MVVHKRKKVLKYRGHTTHGCGSRKKRRGAGSRGGRGNAGSGKRAGHKKLGHILGKFGFKPRRSAYSQKAVKAINVDFFTKEKVESLVKEGKAAKEKDHIFINLEDLGYNKLLGTGEVTMKLKLQVQSYSAQAAEKIKAAGGEVVSSSVA